jgi:hypothetical protein
MNPANLADRLEHLAASHQLAGSSLLDGGAPVNLKPLAGSAGGKARRSEGPSSPLPS